MLDQLGQRAWFWKNAIANQSETLIEQGYVDEAAFSLPEETLSDPVRTADGWAILRVAQRQGFDAEVFDRERPRVVASLRQQKQGQVFQAYMGSARERYEVRRNAAAYRRALERYR